LFILSATLFFIISFLLKDLSPSYCIDEEAERKILETVKDINPSVTGNTVNLQTQSINVNVPTGVLNNIGLGGTVLGGMKIGTSIAKGGSP